MLEKGSVGQEHIDQNEIQSTKTREFLFYPETKIEHPPIHITVVGTSETSSEEQKKILGEIVAKKTTEKMRTIINKGKKVLWNMATGSSFNWKENLPQAMAEQEIDSHQVIPIIKEEVWGGSGQHYSPGDNYDFRGRRIKSFHQLFGIEPQNVTVRNGVIEGNIVAPDYDMSPEEGVAYMNTTWHDLIASNQVEGLITSGVGEDTHVSEMQINKLGRSDQLNQMDFFLKPVEDYSEEKGLFRWLKDENEFRTESNVYTEYRGDKWVAAGRTSEEDLMGGSVMGMGWRAMLEAKGGAIFAFDSTRKAFAAKSALAGSFSGVVKDADGIEIGRVEMERGKGQEIWPELIQFVRQLQSEGLIEDSFVDDIETKYPPAKKEGHVIGQINEVLERIYEAYRKNKILPTNESDNVRYFQPVWKIANEYLGLRSPVAMWIRELEIRNIPIELVLTHDAASELAFINQEMGDE